MPKKNSKVDVGRKIADALKAQSEIDLGLEEDLTADEFLNNDFASEEFQTEEQDFDIESAEDFLEDNYDTQEDDYTNYDENDQVAGYNPVFKMNQKEAQNDELKLSIDSEDTTDEFEMPNNINVLKRLIGQLPSGVPKQTGALIIRQTIEALGISMKSVLQDAQRAKDCLNSSIKDCTFTIQEYKTNIRNLEKQSLGYQRQLAKLNDIIGLFVYNEKNSK